jgi:endoglycosylceramidase
MRNLFISALSILLATSCGTKQAHTIDVGITAELPDITSEITEIDVLVLDLSDAADINAADASDHTSDSPTDSADLDDLFDVTDAGDLDTVTPDLVEPLPPYEPTAFVGTDGKHFRDEKGRLLLLHGVNVSNASKSAPFFPQWLEPDHFQMLSDRGLNVIRFLVIWEAIEPERDVFNQDYLDMVEEKVAQATERGIYVLIDMHQDLWGPKFGGDGAPLWATLDHDLPFDPPPGEWFQKYGEPAVMQSFQSFWDNEEDLQEHFIMAWQEVAKRFQDNSMVIGYDLINEPFTGNWSVMDIPQFEAEVLTPFYTKVAAGIREVDTNHIIFVEPTASKGLGLKGGIGPIGDDKVAYAAHYYHPTMDILYTYSDKQENMLQVFKQIRDEAWAMGGPPFLGEFGFYVGFPGDTEYTEHQLNVMAATGMSFTAWSLDPCSGFLCLLSNDMKPLWSLEYLTRTVPQRIQGQLVSWNYDRPVRTLDLVFNPDGMEAGETTIFVPALNYPLGVIASCTSPDGSVCSAEYDPETSLVIVPMAADSSGEFQVRVEPVRAYPAPAAGLSTHTSLGNADAQIQELDMEETLGVQVLRTDFKWSKIEPQEGAFNFAPYDTLVANAAARGMQMLALLDYSQAWAESEPGQTSTLDVSKFAAFAGATAAHYSDEILWYEVWNEPNLERFWKPEPDPVAYGALLKATAIAIRSGDPTSVIAFGGLASSGPITTGTWPFLNAVLNAHPDIGNYFDVLALHPYTLAQALSPEQPNAAGTYTEMLDEAVRVMSRYGLERKPIIITEMGWPACPCPPLEPPLFIPNVLYDEQASYLARAVLLAWTRGIEMFLWYDFYDGSGNAELFSEDWFGLVQNDIDPSVAPPPETKPAYHAYQTLIPLLEGRVFVADESSSDACRLLKFNGPSGALYAAWQALDSETCEFELALSPGQDGTLLDGFGQILGTTTGPDSIILAPGPMPVYVMVWSDD